MKNYTEKKPFVTEEIASLLDAYQMSKQPMQTPDIGYVSPNTEPMIEETLNAISAQEQQAQVPELEVPELEIPQPEQNQEVSAALESLQTQASQPQAQPAPQTKLGQALPRLGAADRVASLEKLLQQYQDYSKSAQDRLIKSQEVENQGKLLADFSNAMTQVNEALANRAGTTNIKYDRQQYTPTQIRNTKDLLGLEEAAIAKQAAIEESLIDAKSPKPQIYQTKSGVYEVRPDGTINPLVQEPTAVPGQLSEKDKRFLDIKAQELKQRYDIFKESEKRRIESVELGKMERPVKLFNSDKVIAKAQSRLADADAAEFILNTKNPIGDESVKTFLARASGEVGTLTDQDAARFGGSKALTSRIAAIAEQYNSGRITEENRNYLLQLTQAFKQSAQNTLEKRADQIASQQSKTVGIDKKRLKDAMLGYDSAETNVQKTDDTVKLRSPDGKQVVKVKKDSVQKYLDKGATIVED